MMTQFIERWAHICLNYRKSVLAVLAVITGFAVSALPRVGFDNSLGIWFLDDDPTLLTHERMIDTFGSDELIIVGLDAPDVFAPEILERVDRLTRAIAEAPNVEKVFSLTNIEAVTGHDGYLDVGDLVEFPLDPAALPAVRERALANDLYVGNVVSADGDFTAILARLPHRKDDFDYKLEAVQAIRALLAAEPGTQFYMGGGPVMDERFFEVSEHDSKVMTGLMAGILIVVLAVLFRSVWGVVIPFVTVFVAMIWSVAWIVFAGRSLTVISTMLPPLMLAVGVADSVHVLVDYRQHCRAGRGKTDALLRTYRALFLPCLLTSATTSVGLLALLVSRVEGIREFGVFGALGVFGAFFLSVTFVPIALSYLPMPVAPAPSTARPLRSARWLGALHELTMAHGGRIVAVSVVITAVAVASATRVKSESAFLEYFRETDAIRVDTRYLEQKLGGTMTMEVVVGTSRAEGVKDPEVLRRITELQEFLEADRDVGSTLSAADYFMDLRRAFFDNDQAEYRLPETAEEAAQFLLLYEMSEPEGDIMEFVSYDHSEGRISARLEVHTAERATALVKRVRAYAAEHFPDDITVTVTGVAMLYMTMEDYIRLSLLKGFSLALVAIFLFLCLQFRSVGLGAISMVPNVMPIVICLGVMGAAGILLDTMTAMVASIAIGLAVDDTVHFMSRMEQHRRAGASMPEALRDTTIDIGRALVFTSLVLCAGFGVMLTSDFVGTVHFGLLCTITVAVALIADLLLLPVLLRWYDRARAPKQAPARPAAAVLSEG